MSTIFRNFSDISKKIPVQGVVQELKGSDVAKPITNYEYEVDLNEKKRIIRLPKAEYIDLIRDDLRRSMKYDTILKTTVDSKLTKAYNPKLSGI